MSFQQLRRPELGTDLAWGAKYGLLLGALFSAVVVAGMLVRGPAVYGSTSFLRIVVLTITFGIFAGLFIGLLRPFTQRYWAMLTIAFVGGAITYAFVLVLTFGIDGLKDFEPRLALGVVLGCTIVGLRATTLVRRQDR
jgi:hypothetical protein